MIIYVGMVVDRQRFLHVLLLENRILAILENNNKTFTFTRIYEFNFSKNND